MYHVPCTVISTVCCLDSVTDPAASVPHKAQHCQTHRHWSLCSSSDISSRHTNGAAKQKLVQEIFSYENEKRLECRTSGKRCCLHWMEADLPFFPACCLWWRSRCVWRSNGIAGWPVPGMAPFFPGKSWPPSWNCSSLPPQIASLPLTYMISGAETRRTSPSCAAYSRLLFGRSQVRILARPKPLCWCYMFVDVFRHDLVLEHLPTSSHRVAQ